MCMKFIRPWQKIPRWSLTGKTVYKVMRKSKIDQTICYSAHRDHPYMIGEEQQSIIDTDYDGDVTYGLHTFPYLSDAIEELNRERRGEWFHANERPESKFAIYECQVPRGARYYRGVWEYHWPSQSIANLVTNRLIIVREVVLSQDQEKLKAWDEKEAVRLAKLEELKNKPSTLTDSDIPPSLAL